MIKFGSKILIHNTIYPVINRDRQKVWLKTRANFVAIKLSNTRIAEGFLKEYREDHEEGYSYRTYLQVSRYLKATWICQEGKKPERVLLEDIEEI